MYLENNEVKIYPVKAFLAWFLVLLWMALIFAMSHQTSEESSQLSRGLSQQILSIIQEEPSEELIVNFERDLRIGAHAITYFVLALLTSWAFAHIKVKDIHNALLTFLICVLYAASDELHQAFVPGRAATFFDFMVDVGGILAGILVYQVASTIRYLRQELQVERQEELRL